MLELETLIKRSVSASSVSGRSGCPSRPSSPRPVSASSASTSTGPRSNASSGGENDIADVEDSELQSAIRTGRLSATDDWRVVAYLDVLIACVLTPFTRNKEPDLSAVVAAVHAIGKRLRRGQLVVLESTTYPGTTEEVLRPLLGESGLQVGTDFGLAYSLERVNPGNRFYQITNS